VVRAVASRGSARVCSPWLGGEGLSTARAPVVLEPAAATTSSPARDLASLAFVLGRRPSSNLPQPRGGATQAPDAMAGAVDRWYTARRAVEGRSAARSKLIHGALAFRRWGRGGGAHRR
jgi:hypothetical protein